jgi:hypothetical protein
MLYIVALAYCFMEASGFSPRRKLGQVHSYEANLSTGTLDTLLIATC